MNKFQILSIKFQINPKIYNMIDTIRMKFHSSTKYISILSYYLYRKKYKGIIMITFPSYLIYNLPKGNMELSSEDIFYLF